MTSGRADTLGLQRVRVASPGRYERQEGKWVGVLQLPSCSPFLSNETLATRLLCTSGKVGFMVAKVLWLYNAGREGQWHLKR